jgi:hypothetical protein
LILADEKASSVSSALDDNAFLFGLADYTNYDDSDDNDNDSTNNDRTDSNSNSNENTINNINTNNGFENSNNKITTKLSELDEPSGFRFDDNVFLFGLADNANYIANNNDSTNNNSNKNDSNSTDNTINNNNTNNGFENSNNKVLSREKESSSDTPFRFQSEYGRSLGIDVGAGMGL